MGEQVHPVLLDVRVAAASRLYKVYLKLFPCYESEYLYGSEQLIKILNYQVRLRSKRVEWNTQPANPTDLEAKVFSS